MSSVSAAAPNSHWPYPRFIAHRGGGTLAPENTLAVCQRLLRLVY